MDQCNYTPPTLSVDEALKVLAAPPRRRLLRLLFEEMEDVVYRDDLAERMADDCETETMSLEAALAHHHLPRLDAMNVVEYDHRSGAVRLAPPAVDLKPLLDLLAEWEEAQD